MPTGRPNSTDEMPNIEHMKLPLLRLTSILLDNVRDMFKHLGEDTDPIDSARQMITDRIGELEANELEKMQSQSPPASDQLTRRDSPSKGLKRGQEHEQDSDHPSKSPAKKARPNPANHDINDRQNYATSLIKAENADQEPEDYQDAQTSTVLQKAPMKIFHDGHGHNYVVSRGRAMYEDRSCVIHQDEEGDMFFLRDSYLVFLTE